MTQIYYHVSTDQHSTYLDSLEEAKRVAKKLKKAGDSNIRLFKTTKQETGDVVNLNEESIAFKENMNSEGKLL